MTLEAMTFASEIHYDSVAHRLTDEYAAALLAMERGEPGARACVLYAYEKLLALSRRHGRPAQAD